MNFFRRLFSQPAGQPMSDPSAAAPTILEKPAEPVPPAEPAQESAPEPAPAPETTTTLELVPANIDTRIYADGVTRPLPPEPVQPLSNHEHLVFGQLTDVGMVRSNNQDAAISFF